MRNAPSKLARSKTARPDRAAEVTIERLGGRGDGIAQTEAGPVFVPAALPGEQMLVRLGKPRSEGFAARVFQHEFDHLDGILFPQRVEHPRWLLPNAALAQQDQWSTGWPSPGARRTGPGDLSDEC